MREIKFRGRENDPRYGMHWVYGDLTHNFGSPCIARRLVEEFTVGQFTGLLDSEGREIYEGDVVRFAPPLRWEDDERKIGVVVYKYFAFVVKYGDLTVGLFSLAANDAPFTVIGNIYDNPELLEAKDA